MTYSSDYHDLDLGRSQKSKSKIRYDPILITLVSFISICSITSVFLFFIFIVPLIQSYQNLANNDIPAQIKFYQELAQQQNISISSIENKINFILNDPTMDQIKNIVSSIDLISTQINITQIQKDLSQIVLLLEKVIH